MNDKQSAHFEKYIKADIYQESKRRYLNGESLTSIEKSGGMIRNRLAALLKYEGIEIRQNNSKHTYNTDAFKIVDTEEKAYWLGFLYADGCVTLIGTKGVKVSLSAVDEKHLEKFKNFLAPTAEIQKYEAYIKGKDKDYNSVRVTITNKEIAYDLVNLGCYADKTEIIEFPFFIPKKLYKHFIRGFFDGDGCIANGVKGIFILESISESFVRQIQSVLCDEAKIKKNKVSPYKRGSANKVMYRFFNQAKEDLLKIYNYFYDDSTVYLERKKEIFERWIGHLLGNKQDSNGQNR